MMLKTIALLVATICAFAQESEKEYPPYDGWYNNRAHPEWGVVDMPLTRRLPSHYQDGVYSPSGWNRPNPRTVSEAVMKGDTGKNSYTKKTALMVFFGQQVVEEILDAQRPGCPPEYFNIPIPKNDSLYDKEGTGTVEIPLVRSRYQQAISGFSPNFPRQQLNEITPFIDGGLTYGVNKAWSDALRNHGHCDTRTADSNIFSSPDPSDCRGELASEDDAGRLPIRNDIGLPLANPPPPRDHELKSATRFYRLGNPRGNENPFLLTFGVLWFRHHNFLAKRIREAHPDYSDEKVFNEARILNIAIHQRIIFYEWLPIFLGDCPANSTNCDDVPSYSGYKSSVHPGVTHVFQSAAMRFGHTLVPPGVFRRTQYDNNTGSCEFINTTMFTAGDRHGFSEVHVGNPALRTCNTYWNSIEAVSENSEAIANLLMGMASQLCEREDNIITPDLRGSVFGPLEFSRRDLMAINIQRGRDHGLPDYNTARESLGLGRRNTFEEVNPEFFSDPERNGPEVLQKFINVHEGNLENIDIWTGGLLETTKNGPGELFRTVILDQFVRIRDGDRFWFENTQNGLLSAEDLEYVWNTTIKDVVLRTNPQMTDNDIQDHPFIWNPANDPKALCPQPFALSEVHMEECTEPEYFDYFSGSEISFALSWASFGVFTILMLLLLKFLGKRSEKMRKRVKKRAVQRTQENKQQQSNIEDDATVTEEVLGKNERQVQVVLGPDRAIHVKSTLGKRLRIISLNDTQRVPVQQSTGGSRHLYVARFDHGAFDLVLSFDDEEDRAKFHDKLHRFLQSQSIHLSPEPTMKEKLVLQEARTKEKRDRDLQKFFKDALSSNFNLHQSNQPIPKELQRYADIELSKREFAEQFLKLKPDSMFVEQMFQIADKDQNGFISFREFMEILWIFNKGTPEQRLKMMFDMYDIDKSGTLDVEEFKTMLKSMTDMVDSKVESSNIDELVSGMMERHGLENKRELTFEDFKKVMSQYTEELSETFDGGRVNRDHTIMHQGHPGRRMTRLHRARQTLTRYSDRRRENGNAGGNGVQNRIARRRATIEVVVNAPKEPEGDFERALMTVQRYIRNYRMHIFWLVTYTIVAWAIFAERVYYYSVEREHGGLRRICGFGVSFTRGAASGMMFTYSCLLVTMCRNTITLLRETFLHRYIPFDSAVSMHRYIAWQAMIFTVIHIIGHSVNFYSISTQPTSDLSCLFPDYWRTSDALPKFHYWCWQTITGIAGVVCTLIVITMYIFASDYSRRMVFRWFWWTHNFGYVLLYIFMILHGSGFLVQRPFFYYFFLGPAVLYTLDKLYSISRNRNEISVVKAELLPSDVTCLEFKRPATFDYRAGQWVRIACLAQSHNEYHPFTLTSCPNEENLKVHIRAVGPWTMNLRKIYDPDVLRDSPYPKLYLDGPFGEGHQDWYKFEVAVLVGGGIGVTPFASILKDLVHQTSGPTDMKCKKVFFLWVTREQKQYEWLTDIIEEVERTDFRSILDTHIFITQVQSKFDFRTTMLYVCERNFQKIAGKSLLTGLRAVTHFGRPVFKQFFTSLANEYSTASDIGVFSCGPPPMTHDVDGACAEMNKSDGPAFSHHFENF